MALRNVSRTENTSRATVKRLGRLATSAVDGVSAFYATMARFLIGGVEDFSDLAAARRSRRVNLAAVKQQAGTAKTRRLRG